MRSFAALLIGITLLALNPLVNADDPEPKVPTLYIIGDSTVKNGTKGQQGWGDPLTPLFDSKKIKVLNHAIGGRSSRTFLTEGRWDKIVKDLKPGDFVLMQFGHNDGGMLTGTRPRASLKGNGDETREVILDETTGKKEVVHTYGWYMRKYAADAKAKGATAIVLSPVPRNMWKDDKVNRASNDYGKWAAEAAKAEKGIFLDLNDLVAKRYEAVGEEKVKTEYFGTDHTHTTPAGAQVTAAVLAEAIKVLKDCELRKYLKTESK